MIKKLTLLAMAVGALVAFAVPAMASADVRITDGSGNPLSVNDTITAVSTNAQTVTGAGTLVCSEVHLGVVVTQNDEETVKLSDDTSTPGAASGCKVKENNLPVTVTPTIEEIHITTGGTKTATFRFIAHLGGVGGPQCEYKTNPAKGKEVNLSYESGSSTIHAEGTLEGSGVAPCSASAAFSGDFALSREGGIALM